MFSRMDIREIDLRRLNSLTKYPSIPTYHSIGEKGRLLDKLEVSFEGEPEIIVTEKVDGTNARVILLPDKNFLVGSREELLHYHGDIIANPVLGIVDAIRPSFGAWARLANHVQDDDYVTVYFGEVFGSGVGNASKHYTGEGLTGFRLLDVFSIDDLRKKLQQTPEQIALWRDRGGQKFIDEQAFQFVSRDFMPTAPRLKVTRPLPTSIVDTFEWLMEVMPRSLCMLDPKGTAKPEGVVVRTPDRRKIAKIRYEDYERTARLEAKKVG